MANREILLGVNLVITPNHNCRTAAIRDAKNRHGRIVCIIGKPTTETARLADGFGFEVVKVHLMGKTGLIPITLDQIVEETREMPAEVVAELVDLILIARHGGVEPSVAGSWRAETDRRIAEIESGKVKGVTPEENAARIQKILQR